MIKTSLTPDPPLFPLIMRNVDDGSIHLFNGNKDEDGMLHGTCIHSNNIQIEVGDFSDGLDERNFEPVLSGFEITLRQV